MDDDLYAQVSKELGEDTLSAWISRLESVFRDDRKKRRAIGEIKDEIKAQLGDEAFRDLGVTAAERSDIANAFIADLAGQVAAKIGRPEGTRRTARKELPKRIDFVREITRTYPYPIAHAYRTFHIESSPGARLGSLFQVYEALIHYLATVVVSTYFQSPKTSTQCNQHLYRLFAGRDEVKWSVGDLYSLLTQTLQHGWADLVDRIPYGELPGQFFKGPKRRKTFSNELLNGFVYFRNRLIGHAEDRSDASAAGWLPLLQKRLEEELWNMEWLKDWQLVRPMKAGLSDVLDEVEVLMGDLRLPVADFSLRLGENTWDRDGGSVQEEKTLLLVSPDRSEYRVLSPFTLCKENRGDPTEARYDFVGFLGEMSWRRKPPPLEPRQLLYRTYEPPRTVNVRIDDRGSVRLDEDRLREHVGDLAGRLLKAMINELESSLTVPGLRDGEPRFVTGEVDFTLADTIEASRDEQRRHREHFVGRRDTLARIQRWIGRARAGSCLMVTGAPGRGKSALAAELAHRESESRPCLLHMVSSERDPYRFIPALISQIDEMRGAGPLRTLANAEPKALGQALRHALSRWGQKGDARSDGEEPIHRDAVLIIDGIDEITEIRSIRDLLPSLPPAGVRIILTGVRGREWTDEFLRDHPEVEPVELSNLSDAETREFVRRTVGTQSGEDLPKWIDVAALYSTTGGTPLLLRLMANALTGFIEESRALGAPPRRFDVEENVRSADAIWQDAYNEIGEERRRDSSGDAGTQRSEIVKLVASAREPLTHGQLVELCQASSLLGSMSSDGVWRRVGEMRDYVVGLGGDRYQIWHGTFVEFLRRSVLLGTEAIRIHRTFADWLDLPPRELSTYGLRHKAWHLLQARQDEELYRWLAEPDVIRERLNAGCLREVMGDFRALREAGKERADVYQEFVRGLEGRGPEGFWLELRTACTAVFGDYSAWPEGLRGAFEASSHPSIVEFLGETYDAERRFPEAEAQFRALKTASIESKDFRLLGKATVLLATTLEHQKQYHAALAELDAYLGQDGEANAEDHVDWARYQKGINLIRLERYDEARTVLEQLQVSTNQGRRLAALHQLGVIDLERARTTARPLRHEETQAPTDYAAHLAAAEQRFERCLADRRLSGAKEWDHRLAFEHRRLGQVWALRGDLARARQHFDDAMDISARTGHWRYVAQTQEDIAEFIIARVIEAERPRSIEPVRLTEEYGVERESLAAGFRRLAQARCGYLETMNPDTRVATGEAWPWESVHSEPGMWHGTIGVLVFDDEGRLCVQTRGETDSRGRMDLSVTGHIDVGEDDVAAALHEAEEEIGLFLRPERLERFGTSFDFRKQGTPDIASDHHDGADPRSYYYRAPVAPGSSGRWNRELVSYFLVRLSGGERMRLEKTMTEGIKRLDATRIEWVSPEDVQTGIRASPDSYASGIKQLFGHPELVGRILEQIERRGTQGRSG